MPSSLYFQLVKPGCNINDYVSLSFISDCKVPCLLSVLIEDGYRVTIVSPWTIPANSVSRIS